MPNIKVVGSPKSYPLESVSGIVTKIAGKYYFKDDAERVVYINRPQGWRYARRTSKRLVQLMFGGYGYIEDCVECPYVKGGDKYLLAHTPDTVQLTNGNYEHRDYVVTHHSGAILSSRDPESVKRKLVRTMAPNHRSYAYIDETYELDRNTYRSRCYALKDHCVKIDQLWYLIADIVSAVYDISEANRLLRRHCHKDRTTKCVIGIVGGAIVYEPFESSYVSNSTRFRVMEDPVSRNVVRVLIAPALSSVKQMNLEAYFNMGAEAADQLKQRLSSQFSDMDATENVAETIDTRAGQRAGKEHIGGTRSRLEISPTRDLVGGIKYTFGVEVETSGGIIPNSILNSLGIEAVGDRSIGSAEYVSPPLHGDLGVGKLTNLMRQVREHTLVDDRCAIHIHVGGVSPNDYGTSVTEIKFDYHFAIKIISLCAHIEEEIFQILPKNRSPFFRHCHSIRRYKDINLKNWKPYLGSYVFGPEENWDHNYNMCEYEYGRGRYTKSSSLGTRWPAGRYKWLNLTNAYSSGSFSTVEFRVFSGTTNPHKVYCYLLISLALVKYADSYMKIGEKLPTLMQLLQRVYPDKYLLNALDEFVTKRKRSFDRGDVYEVLGPDGKPYHKEPPKPILNALAPEIPY